MEVLGASCGKVFEGRQTQELKPQGGTQKVKTEKEITAGRPANQGESEGAGSPAKINADKRYEGTQDRMTAYGGLLALIKFLEQPGLLSDHPAGLQPLALDAVAGTSAPARGNQDYATARLNAAEPGSGSHHPHHPAEAFVCAGQNHPLPSHHPR